MPVRISFLAHFSVVNFPVRRYAMFLVSDESQKQALAAVQKMVGLGSDRSFAALSTDVPSGPFTLIGTYDTANNRSARGGP
jgi:hypothetical protein